jgi:hypothetical protein
VQSAAGQASHPQGEPTLQTKACYAGVCKELLPLTHVRSGPLALRPNRHVSHGLGQFVCARVAGLLGK